MSEPQQLSFFESDDQPAAPEHPGQLPFQEWVKNRSTVFHASHRADWQQGEYAHVGSQSAASDRLMQVASNTRPGERGSEHDMPGGGRIVARRMVQSPAMTATSDSNLNIAQMGLTYHPHDVGASSSIKDRPEVEQIAEHLRAGRPVAYPNAFEDIGTHSALVPQPAHNLRAWHEDVTEAVSMGLPVHPHDVALAKQQFDPDVEITPQSMQYQAKRVLHPRGEPQQLSLMPWSVGQKIFPINPNDPHEDADAWGHVTPGRGSWQRAQAHAEATGQKTSLTRAPAPDQPFPRGRGRLGRRRPE